MKPCKDDLTARLKETCNNRPRGDHDMNVHLAPVKRTRPAAVMILLVRHSDSYTVIFTQRTDALPHHAGQVSFPGGKMEKKDKTIFDTALRETEEEIGISPKDIEVLGRLDTYITRSGFEIIPVVGMITPPVKILPDPNEVKAVFEVPLNKLVGTGIFRRARGEFKGRMYEFLAFEHEDWTIWGATAAMLKNLIEHLEDTCRPEHP